MPENKLQHYVPRCHLKPFSKDGLGLAINLYNVALNRAIPSAPVKGQCAKDYFYGEDLIIERLFQPLEGAYAKVLKSVEGELRAVGSGDLAFLRDFSVMQYLRSYGSIEKSFNMSRDLAALINEGLEPEYQIPRGLDDIREAMLMSMSAFGEVRHAVEDLHCTILLNKTALDFITSDDPSVMTNRMHLQRFRSDSFGWTSAGALIVLPLTPRIAFMAYDSSCYWLPAKRGHVTEVKNPKDVQALNTLQFVHARKNIYFSDWRSRGDFGTELARNATLRPDNWGDVSLFRSVGKDERGESYERVAWPIDWTKGPYLTQVSSKQPRYDRWPSSLQYRAKPKFNETGTGAGVTRPGGWHGPNV